VFQVSTVVGVSNLEHVHLFHVAPTAVNITV